MLSSLLILPYSMTQKCPLLTIFLSYTLVVSDSLALQRHFRVLTKFAHVESRLSGRKRQRKAAFDVPLNPCARSVCSRSVAVGLVTHLLYT
jgi:hypothetical protein